MQPSREKICRNCMQSPVVAVSCCLPQVCDLLPQQADRVLSSWPIGHLEESNFYHTFSSRVVHNKMSCNEWKIKNEEHQEQGRREARINNDGGRIQATA